MPKTEETIKCSFTIPLYNRFFFFYVKFGKESDIRYYSISREHYTKLASINGKLKSKQNTDMTLGADVLISRGWQRTSGLRSSNHTFYIHITSAKMDQNLPLHNLTFQHNGVKLPFFLSLSFPFSFSSSSCSYHVLTIIFFFSYLFFFLSSHYHFLFLVLLVSINFSVFYSLYLF